MAAVVSFVIVRKLVGKKDTELGHRGKAMYIYWKDHANKQGTCWPGINTIAAELDLSRSTVNRKRLLLQNQDGVL